MATENRQGGLKGAPDGFEPARRAILDSALKRAPFEGWTRSMMAASARDAGVAASALAAAFPRGVADLLRYWSEENDAAMSAALGKPDFASKRVREKVEAALWARLDALRPHKEAARRAAATLALPFFAPLAGRLAWKTADAVWRGLADKSTDFNFYTKRAILTGVWTSTFARWLADDSPDEGATRKFMDARIENVMQFEKLKAQIRDNGFDPEGMFGWLAKVRYPRDGSSRAEREREEAKVDDALKGTFPASDAPYWTRGVRK
jgi:ubiquinone biosynthesis protein COQ9